MAPEIEETTPAVVEPTPEAPPVAPEETGAEPLEAPVAELAEFRAARKAEREGVVEDTVEEPAPDVQAPPTEEPVGVENQIVDPDTGEVLDRRTRAAKRIESFLRERHELRLIRMPPLWRRTPDGTHARRCPKQPNNTLQRIVPRK